MILEMLDAIVQRDWDRAQHAFTEIMQERVNTRLSSELHLVFENTMPTVEVQRVFDEIGDVGETELLCGVRDLKVNTKGEVVGFRGL